MRYLTLSFFSAISLYPAAAQMPSGDKNSLDELSWLQGTWENKTARGRIYESWRRDGDTSLRGKSYMIRGKDTLVFERISLVLRAGELFYIPTVSDQNSGRAVSFRQSSIIAGHLVFENLQHDFPQKISYTLIGQDSLLAVISGMKNGKERAQLFPMKRMK